MNFAGVISSQRASPCDARPFPKKSNLKFEVGVTEPQAGGLEAARCTSPDSSPKIPLWVHRGYFPTADRRKSEAPSIENFRVYCLGA